MKNISHLLGLDFIKNQTVKKIARVVLNSGLVLLAGTPYGAPLLAVLGVVPGPDAAAIVATAGALLEGVRNAIKHQDAPPAP